MVRVSVYTGAPRPCCCQEPPRFSCQRHRKVVTLVDVQVGNCALRRQPLTPLGTCCSNFP